MTKLLLNILLIATISLSAACTTTITNLGKSEIDMVSDSFINTNTEYISKLAIQLYKYNPKELNKSSPSQTVEKRITQMSSQLDTSYAEINHTTATSTILLALDKHYSGDRVFALLRGIHSMLYYAYGGRTEVFMFDTLAPQPLYNSARNLEIVLIRLQTETYRGQTLLKMGPIMPKESAYNLLIKMVANQDIMVKLNETSSHRVVNRIVHSTAGLLLPVMQ